MLFLHDLVVFLHLFHDCFALDSVSGRLEIDEKMVPLVDVVVREAVRRSLQAESCPEGRRFICLLNKFDLGRGSLMLLHQSEMIQSCLLVGFKISSWNFAAGPQPCLISCLNNK